MGLAGMLEKGERVEADMGYRGSAPQHVICPGLYMNPDMKAISARVRSRQETVNKRFKQWNILVAAYRHDILDHQMVFGAIAALTQLSFEHGEPLFSVDYNDH